MTRYVCVYTQISHVAPELWCGYGVSTYVPMVTLTLILHQLETRSGCNINDQGISGKKVCGCFDPKCWDWDVASSQSASLLSPNSPIKLSMDILIVPPSRYASHCLIYP
jgi:hypothetical protein